MNQGLDIGVDWKFNVLLWLIAMSPVFSASSNAILAIVSWRCGVLSRNVRLYLMFIGVCGVGTR